MANELALPSVFDTPTSAPVVPAGNYATYGIFLDPKSSKFTEITTSVKGAKPGDMILVTSDKYLKVDPPRFYILQGRQFWGKFEDDGKKLVAVSLSEPPYKSGFSEVVETCILAIHKNSLIPARFAFKTYKAAAGRNALAALVEASGDEWFKKSADHKATAKIAKPFARFTAKVNMTPGTAKSTGRKYLAANVEIEPTTMEDWKVLNSYLSEPCDELAKVADSYTERMKLVDALVS